MITSSTSCFSSVVAPFTGAWIEMITSSTSYFSSVVAPFTGAWIEISSAVRFLEAT